MSRSQYFLVDPLFLPHALLFWFSFLLLFLYLHIPIFCNRIIISTLCRAIFIPPGFLVSLRFSPFQILLLLRSKMEISKYPLESKARHFTLFIKVAWNLHNSGWKYCLHACSRIKILFDFGLIGKQACMIAMFFIDRKHCSIHVLHFLFEIFTVDIPRTCFSWCHMSMCGNNHDSRPRTMPFLKIFPRKVPLFLSCCSIKDDSPSVGADLQAAHQASFLGIENFPLFCCYIIFVSFVFFFQSLVFSLISFIQF